jgi:threonine 3-dehydrogenase
MKALRKEKPGPGLALSDIPEPEIVEPDDVKFKVEYCAICVGEVKAYDWDDWAASDSTYALPTVLGHEVAAVVSEVGPAVRHFQPGDRIAVDPLIPCGVCTTCRAGYPNMCEQREIYGKRRGAFAEYAVLPDRALCKVPDVLTLQEAALLENLGVAVHAVDVVHHDPGDVAVVLGCGPIGILAAQTLAAWGARAVITDLSAPRLEKARECSGATVVDITEQDPVEIVREMTHGRGAAYVLETAATQAALDQAFDMVRAVGHVVTIGTFGAPVSFNPFFRMTRKEITLHSTMGRTWETWRRMVQMVEAGQLRLRPLISHVLPLEEYERGFRLVKSGTIQKVLLKP